MDAGEAREILDATIAQLRRRSYADWRLALEERRAESREITGWSGARYQLEVSVVWDDEPMGPIRVLAAIDDGGWRSFIPLTDDFIVAPDGSFVGE